MIIPTIFVLIFLHDGASRIINIPQTSSEIYTNYCAPEGSCYPVWRSTRNVSSSQHFYVFPLLQVIPESVKEQYLAVLQRYQISFEVKFFDNCFIRAVVQDISKIEGKPIDSSQIYVLPLKDLLLVWANAEPGIDTIWLPTSPKPQIILSQNVTFTIFARSATASEEFLGEINNTAGFLEETFEIQYKEGNSHKRARLQMHNKKNTSCERDAPSEICYITGSELTQSKLYILTGVSGHLPPGHTINTEESKRRAASECPEPTNDKAQEKIMLIGGVIPSYVDRRPNSNSFEMYIPNDTTQVLTTVMFNRKASVGALLDGKVFVAGGIQTVKRHEEHVVTTEIYDLKTKQWQTGPNMSYSHTHGSACVLDDKLVVCGGEYTNKCEFIKSNGTKWEVMTPMPFNLAYHSCAVVDNILYIIGGSSPNRKNQSLTTQIYDPVSDSWSFGAQLAERRHYAASAVIGKRIITCGGRRYLFGYANAPYCEIYDTANSQKNPTMFGNRLDRNREGFVLLPFHNELYAFGGGGKEVEIYNFKNYTWRSSNTFMLASRSFFVGAVIVE